MRLTVDLDSLQLITLPGDRKRVSLLEFKRGDSTPLEVQFVRAGVAEALPEGAVLSFGLKASGKYDDDFAVFFDAFAEPTATPNFIYAGTPNFNTEALDELLEVDGDSANDKASVDLMGEFSWSVDEDPVSIRTFTVRIHNDVIRGDEGTPLPLPSPLDWLAEHGIVYDPAITGLTGGGATKLDGLAVTADDVGQLRAVKVGSTLHFYSLSAGDVAESSPVVINVDSAPDALSWILQNGRFSSLTSLTFVEVGGAQDGQIGLIVDDGGTSRMATLKATGITGDREHCVPDRDGTLIPFIDITGNTTDNAGVALVGGVFKLVLRHQTEDTWHELTIVDSTDDPGTPTYQISAAL